jgi:glucokinase
MMEQVELESCPDLAAAAVQKTVVGLDIGGTKTAVVEGTTSGRILQRSEVPTNAHLAVAEVWPQLISLIESTIQEARKSGREVAAISVSVGGPLKIREGFLLNPPHLPGWHNFALRDALMKNFRSLPVCVEHDGNAGALAEFHFGVGAQRKDLQHLIFLTFGTGLGAGVIVNGQILHGATDTAGEVGHWRLSDRGPIGYGKSGSWEGYASGAGLVELASEMFPARWNSKTPIRKLVEDMLADDPHALKVAAEAGKWMGRGMAFLIDAFNPEVIVLGSLAVALGERVLGPGREVVKAEALPQAAQACEIAPSVLGSRIGDVAALMAALTDPVSATVPQIR